MKKKKKWVEKAMMISAKNLRIGDVVRFDGCIENGNEVKVAEIFAKFTVTTKPLGDILDRRFKKQIKILFVDLFSGNNFALTLDPKHKLCVTYEVKTIRTQLMDISDFYKVSVFCYETASFRNNLVLPGGSKRNKFLSKQLKSYFEVGESMEVVLTQFRDQEQITGFVLL